MAKKLRIILITIVPTILLIIILFNKPNKINKYEINNKNSNYKIEERKNSTNKFYKVVIKNNNNINYVFERKVEKDKIINIKEYKSNDLICILPIYEKQNQNNFYCNYKGENISPAYLKYSKNEDFEKIIKLAQKNIKNINLSTISTKKKTITKNNNNINVYYKNIPDNLIFTVWQYKGLHTIKKNKYIYNEFLVNDQYNNENRLLVDKYYIIADLKSNQYKIKNFIIYDIEKNKSFKLELPKPISNNYYYNGAYKNNLYITDIDNKVQIVINPKNKKIDEVGNIKKGFINVHSNRKEIIPASIFLEKNYFFNNNIKNKPIEKMYGSEIEIREKNDRIYFKTTENEIYLSYNDIESKPILLLKLDDIKDWKISENNELIIVTTDKMYFYNSKGLLPIIENKEFKYKNKNMCGIYNLN